MILVTAVKNHEEHKKSLLKLIDEFIVETIDDHHNTQYETLSTDFHLPINVERPWNDYFYKEIVNDFVESMVIKLDLNPCKWDIHESWFQRYKVNNTHDWHNHSGCQFSNVYFLEMPHGHQTEIVGMDGRLIEYNAKEGDIITFPAWMKHRSLPNTGEQKTVIAFNSSFEYEQLHTNIQ
jgi:hypothetical protein